MRHTNVEKGTRRDRYSHHKRNVPQSSHREVYGFFLDTPCSDTRYTIFLKIKTDFL